MHNGLSASSLWKVSIHAAWTKGVHLRLHGLKMHIGMTISRIWRQQCLAEVFDIEWLPQERTLELSHGEVPLPSGIVRGDMAAWQVSVF